MAFANSIPGYQEFEMRLGFVIAEKARRQQQQEQNNLLMMRNYSSSSNTSNFSLFSSNESSTSGSILPPTHTVSDYVTIVYCIFGACVGIPVNLVAMRRLVSQLFCRTYTRTVLLSLHLTISNLLILTFASFGKAAWYITYQWHAGEVACKLFKFVEIFSFYLASNMIVAIAVDMMITFTASMKFYRGIGRVKSMLCVSWAIAFLCSLPQFWLWEVQVPFESSPEWRQCVFIYRNSTFELQYNLAHIMVVFWIPLILMLISYATVVVLVGKRGKYIKRESEINIGTKRTSMKSLRSLRQRKTFSLAANVIGLYILFALPYQCLALWRFLSRESYTENSTYVDWFYMLIVSNACANPFIYSFRVRDTRPSINLALMFSFQLLYKSHQRMFKDGFVD